MCKFENENAPGFDLVVEGIQRYAEAAPAKIKRNWDTENQERNAAKQAEAAELYSGMLCPSLVESCFNNPQPASRTHLRRHIPTSQTPAVPLDILHEVGNKELCLLPRARWSLISSLSWKISRMIRRWHE